MSRRGVICASLALVVGLPLLGVLLAGEPIWRYLEFPPRTKYVEHEPFSWTAFIALTLLIVLLLAPILFRIVVSNHGVFRKRFTPHAPLVGVARNRLDGTVVGAGLEPLPMDGLASGTYIHAIVDRVHRGRECLHVRPHRTLHDGASTALFSVTLPA